MVAVATCQTPDPDVVLAVEEQTQQFAQRATDLADASDGDEHQRALDVRQALDESLWTIDEPGRAGRLRPGPVTAGIRWLQDVRRGPTT